MQKSKIETSLHIVSPPEYTLRELIYKIFDCDMHFQCYLKLKYSFDHVFLKVFRRFQEPPYNF
jgi:hypothetical protein